MQEQLQTEPWDPREAIDEVSRQKRGVRHQGKNLLKQSPSKGEPRDQHNEPSQLAHIRRQGSDET